MRCDAGGGSRWPSGLWAGDTRDPGSPALAVASPGCSRWPPPSSSEPMLSTMSVPWSRRGAAQFLVKSGQAPRLQELKVPYPCAW